jgi:hypothetical protein
MTTCSFPSNPITSNPSAPARQSCAKLKRRLYLLLFAVTQLALFSRAGALTITLDNSNAQTFALDPIRHFLITAEGAGAGTKHLSVISTLTNTVVGTYNFTGSGFTSEIAASGTQAFWADQGDSKVRLINISAAGAASEFRLDSFTLPTGIASLGTTYGVTSQGGGDALRIVRFSDGVVLHTTPLGFTGSAVDSDTFTNFYYAANGNSSTAVIDSNGTILRTLTGRVASVDSANHFIYIGLGARSISQLNGLDNSATGKSFDFGVGMSINGVAVDSSTGNLWVTLSGQNVVQQLSSNLTFIQQFTATSPDAIAFDNGNAYIHQSGTNGILVVPEPSAAGLIIGCLGIVSIRRRRRP